MKYEQLTAIIDEKIAESLEEAAQYNTVTAEHPEISGQEFETARRIVKLLTGHQYTIEFPFAGIDTAFRAVFEPNTHRHKVAFLVEYDALPEIGHGCGHSLSGAISILAGLAVKDLQEQLDTDFHIIGTPDEEVEGQKCHMAVQGVFDQYDMVIMIHLNHRNIVEPVLQCCLIRDYHFYGKAAHASAAPWEGCNALNAAQLFLHAIDMLRQHTTADAQFHGIISHGGDFPNIVPEHATVKQMIRALDKDYVQYLDEFLDDCASGAAKATRTTWKKEKCGEDFYNLKVNETGVSAIQEVFDELGLAQQDASAIFGSSDIGNVSFYCPTFQPCLKIGDDETVLHSREFEQLMHTDKAVSALTQGAKILAYTAAKIFCDEEKIAAMQRDFLKG